MGGTGGHEGGTFRRIDAHLLDAVLDPITGVVVEGFARLGERRVDHGTQKHSQRLIHICSRCLIHDRSAVQGSLLKVSLQRPLAGLGVTLKKEADGRCKVHSSASALTV